MPEIERKTAKEPGTTPVETYRVTGAYVPQLPSICLPADFIAVLEALLKAEKTGLLESAFPFEAVLC